MRKIKFHFVIHLLDRNPDRSFVPANIIDVGARCRSAEPAPNLIYGRSRGRRQSALSRMAACAIARWLCGETAHSLIPRRAGRGIVGRAHCVAAFLSGAATTSANAPACRNVKAFARVDLWRAVGQTVPPFAPRIGRRSQVDSVLANTCLVSVHDFGVRCRDRLSVAAASVQSRAKPRSSTLSLAVLLLVTARLVAQFNPELRGLACSPLAAALLPAVPECLLDQTLSATGVAAFDTASLAHRNVHPLPLMSGFVLDAFRTRRMCSTVAESTRRNENMRSEKSVRSGGKFSDSRRQDKSGSPSERQAIDMAWVHPCRSVGVRAAFQTFASEFNDVFGTVPASLVARPAA